VDLADEARLSIDLKKRRRREEEGEGEIEGERGRGGERERYLLEMNHIYLPDFDQTQSFN
jgi:hypothetical protein